MILLVSLQVLDPYRRTDLTFELNILSFVHREMHWDLQMGLRMQKAICTLLHLASASSSVLPVVVIRPLRYLKTVTCSRVSPPQVISPVFADRNLISLVTRCIHFEPNLGSLLLKCL